MVPIYAFGKTDEGKNIILIESTEKSFETHYENVILEHPPPRIDEEKIKEMERKNPDS